MKEKTIRLAAAVVLMQHIMIMGQMSAKGAVASATLPLAALYVSWMILPIGWPDAPKGPLNNAFKLPAVKQIMIAMIMHKTALTEVDQSKDLGMRRLASTVSSAVLESGYGTGSREKHAYRYGLRNRTPRASL